jgi:hypothetical protein
MEGKLGNYGQARELFKAAAQVDPCNSLVWDSWIHMEEVAELLDRAEALRVARARAFAERALPDDFSTLPGSEQGQVMQAVRLIDSEFDIVIMQQNAS